MKKVLALYLPVAICLLSSCRTEYAYYQTPFQCNTAIYKTQPLVKDSIRSAIYVSGVWTTGGANFRLRDAVNGFIGSVYKSHTGRLIQGYYGITGGLGVYDVNDYGKQDPENPENENLNDSLINWRSGTQFFAGLGAVGGVNLVLPFRRGEWRAIGVEANWIREYGDYMKFRKELPDTAANLIDHRQNHFTIGLSTDMVFYRRNGAVGYKIALIWLSRNLREYDVNRQPANAGKPAYISQTVHFTNRRVTSQFQFNFGYRALSFLAGVNYRITK